MTSKAKLEAHLEKKCCAFAEDEGYEHIKLDTAKRKWPDRLFLGPQGQKLLVEFKRVGEEPRKQQAAFHVKLAGMRHFVYVIDNYDAFVSLIRSASLDR